MQQEIFLNKITQEEYDSVKESILEEYTKTLYEKKKGNQVYNFVNFTIFDSNILGIYINNLLVGFIKAVDFIQGKSIDIYILSKYRGRNIAFTFFQEMSDKLGFFYPDCPYFYINIHPNNKQAYQVMKKLQWEQDHSLDEIMLHEGGEFFYLYKVENKHFNTWEAKR